MKKDSYHSFIVPAGITAQLFIICVFFTYATQAASIQIYEESFETDGFNVRYTVENPSDDGGNDFFARREVFSPGTRVSGGTLDGDFFWGARDIDGDGIPVGDLTADEARITFIPPIDIDGIGGLRLEIALASGADSIEPNNILLIEARLDDGPFEALGGFAGTATNTAALLFTGVRDNVPDLSSPALNSTFHNFTFDIFGQGSTLELRINVRLNGGGEEYAFDNLRIVGDDDLAFLTLRIDNPVISESEGEQAATVTIELSEPAPPEGLEIELSSNDDDTTEINIPSSVMIPEGETETTFGVDAVDDNAFDGDQALRIFAAAAGFSTNFINVTVENIQLVPDIIINEVLMTPPGFIPEDLDGDANNDGIRSEGDNEFVEIVNASGSVVDISGWRLSDEQRLRHEFPEGTVLCVGAALVYFAGGEPTGDFGGAIVQTSWRGGSGLGLNAVQNNNQGDRVTITSGGATVATKPLGPVFVVPRESITRDPDITGVFDGEEDGVLHSDATGSNGTLFSPGTRIDGSPFIPFGLNVALDIKPGSCPNPLNVKSKGVVPVAILGTGEFDVNEINLETIQFAGLEPIRFSFEDVATPFEPFSCKEDGFDCTDAGPDGFMDLILRFDTQELVDAIESSFSGPVEDGEVLLLNLEGDLFDGTHIVGEDVMLILKKGKK